MGRDLGLSTAVSWLPGRVDVHEILTAKDSISFRFISFVFRFAWPAARVNQAKNKRERILRHRLTYINILSIIFTVIFVPPLSPFGIFNFYPRPWNSVFISLRSATAPWP